MLSINVYVVQPGHFWMPYRSGQHHPDPPDGYAVDFRRTQDRLVGACAFRQNRLHLRNRFRLRSFHSHASPSLQIVGVPFAQSG
jgi:hypothetical protein